MSTIIHKIEQSTGLTMRRGGQHLWEIAPELECEDVADVMRIDAMRRSGPLVLVVSRRDTCTRTKYRAIAQEIADYCEYMRARLQRLCWPARRVLAPRIESRLTALEATGAVLVRAAT